MPNHNDKSTDTGSRPPNVKKTSRGFRHRSRDPRHGGVDKGEIIRAAGLFCESGQVTELRALRVVEPGYRNPHTVNGYFDDPQQLATSAAGIDRASGTYFVLNPVCPDLRARAANRITSDKITGTSDRDIVSRRWLLVDLDPVRPSGISSSDAEHEAALDRALTIRDVLRQAGWPEPVRADSGNGAHLLYRIDLPTDDGGLVQSVLEALAFFFDDARVTVDTSVANPARLCKLYGTWARKGDDIPERPHRMARLLEIPGELSIVTEEQLEAVAGWRPDVDDVQSNDDYSVSYATGTFDLETWIEDHGLDVIGPQPWQDGIKFVLPECPWNSDHTNHSAFILQFKNGAIAAGCLHASCEGNDWHALRDSVEPDWHDRSGQSDDRYSANSARVNLAWDPPARFDEIASTLSAFPTDALSDWLRDYVEAEAEATQTPRALAGILALTVCAVAASKVVVVRHGNSWSEPTNLYTVAVLLPAMRKSAVVAHMVAPLEDAELALVEAYRPAIAEAREVRRVIEIELKQARKLASKAETAKDRAAALEKVKELARELEEYPVPAEPRLVLNDATPEKVASVLAEQGAVAIMSPEGDVFEMMAGRYSTSGNPNLYVYLAGHAGDSIRVDRVGRDSESVRNPALTIGLTVQPEVLHGLVSKPGFRGRGLLGRFLYVIPATALGRRKIDPPAVPDEVSFNYGHAVRQLLDLSPREDGTRHAVTLSPDANAIFRDFQQEIEYRLADGGDFAGMRDWAGKLAGATLRLAGILHLTDHVEDPEPWHSEITAETLTRAITLARFFAEHAKAAFLQMGADPRVADAIHVLRWIARSGRDEFSKRDAFEGIKGSTRFETVLDLDQSLKLLEAHGYIRTLDLPPRSGPGRPKSPRYEVNPNWQRDEVI